MRAGGPSDDELLMFFFLSEFEVSFFFFLEMAVVLAISLRHQLGFATNPGTSVREIEFLWPECVTPGRNLSGNSFMVKGPKNAVRKMHRTTSRMSSRLWQIAKKM